MTQPDLISFLNEMRGKPKGEFKPNFGYNVEGDQIEVFWGEQSCYAEQLGKTMAIQRSQEDDSVVGVTLYSLKKVLREAGFELVSIKERKIE